MRLWVIGAVKLINIQIFKENNNSKKEKWGAGNGRATSKIRRISVQMKQRLTSPAAAAVPTTRPIDVYDMIVGIWNKNKN